MWSPRKYGRDEVVWSKAPKISLAGAKLLIKDQRDTRKGIMVAMEISTKHAAPPYFCAPGVKINSEFYCDTMMAQHFLPHMAALKPEGFLYQQDNAPAHVSEYSRKWFAKNKVAILGGCQWPPKSADLNPCDYSLWSFMEQQLEPGLKSEQELRTQILKAASKLTPDVLDPMVRNLVKRLGRCVELREGG